MAQPNNKIVYEGWLVKSPPSKRVWRPKWRKRWFALRQSTETPGQYFLDYFSDRNSRKLKGTIDLELCEQVDAGLRMQRRSNDGLGVKGSVFSIRTQSRIYHLEADCVTEMEKWVDIICRVCGMKAMDDERFYTRCNEANVSTQSNSGPYIAISECITGPPKNQPPNSSVVGSYNQTQHPRPSNSSSLREYNKRSRSYVNTGNAFSNANNFTRNALRSSDQPPRLPENIYQNTENMIITTKAHRDSNTQTDNLQQGLSRLSVNDASLPGTSMPPRPPKPAYLSLDVIHKDSFVGPRIHEPHEIPNNSGYKKNTTTVEINHNRSARNLAKANYANTMFQSSKDDQGEEIAQSQGYLNLATPPVVNRTLKPRRIRNQGSFVYEPVTQENSKIKLHSAEESSAKLQYLDLDLDSPSLHSMPSFKSRTETESPTIYKTVDFLKTEALNMTRMDTEAYRRKDVPS